MRAADFVVFPLKTMLIGLTVALTSCLTALEAAPREDAAGLLPRGFVRGVLATLLTSGFLSLAV
jgi:phospholipid/cholesterol/gamma-HCH transport system permease protein